MKWLLLNQLCVNLVSKSLGISVLEEVLSSEQQLVQVLVSGTVSSRTMNSVCQALYNQEEVHGALRL